MKKQARVQLEAVNSFQVAVKNVNDYAVHFDQGLQCLESLTQYIKEQIEKARDAVSNLQKASGVIENKIENTKEKIEKVEQELRDLENQIDSVESELSSTPSTITTVDANGVSHSYPNPEYFTLKSKLSSLRADYSAVKSQLSQLKAQLHQQQDVANRIKTHTENMNSSISALESKINDCSKLQSNISEIKSSVNRCGNAAVDCLKKIEQSVRQYMDTKIKIEAVRPYQLDQNARLEEVLADVISFCFRVAKSVVEKTMMQKQQSEPDSIKSRDDKGKVFRVENDLVKNNTFVINGYTYQTDNQGRTMSVHGKLTLAPKHDRAMEDMYVVGKGDQKETDDRGHLIGHQFNGSDSLENLVPQDYKINRGEYKKLEESLASLVRTGHEVYVDIRPVFPPDSRRPFCIVYRYTVNGETRTRLFPNTSTEG